MTLATIGGILLILGAFFTYRGDIYKSVGVYFLADVCWVLLAIKSSDVQGAVFTVIGMTFGLLAFFKMHNGEFRKNIHTEDEYEVESGYTA